MIKVELCLGVGKDIVQVFSELILENCPFCGSADLEVLSTHTPYYWVECICGAEVNGESFYKSERSHHSREAHRKAALSAILKWNKRS